MLTDRGGKMYHVQGLDCHLPPVPPLETIQNAELATEDQVWMRTPLPIFRGHEIEFFVDQQNADDPVDWEQAERQEFIGITGTDPWDLDRTGNPKLVRGVRANPKFISDPLYHFRNQELRRIFQDGHWIFINGKPHYITQDYYFYLNWWDADNGYPEFRLTGLEGFYFWEHCWLDDTCYGINELEKRGSGKCLADNQLVRIYNSSDSLIAKDVKVGDLLAGDDSDPRLVKDVYYGSAPMYRVNPNKGESHTVSENHILHCVINRPKGPRNKKNTCREYINISVKDYLTKHSSFQKRCKIRRTGWHYDESDHKIDPYFLGLWLGDGRTFPKDRNRSIEVSNIDKEVILYLQETATKFDANLNSSDGLHWLITTSNGDKISGFYGDTFLEFDSKADFNRYFGKNKKTFLKDNSFYREGNWKVVKAKNVLQDEMKSLGMVRHKHIPKLYLCDSMDNRLQLLAGLVDSDGCLVRLKNGNPGFFKISQTVKREKLSKQIIELARSCGFMVNYKIRPAKCLGKTTYHYMIGIYGDIDLIPTKIKRKQAENWDKRYNPLHCGFTIEPIGIGSYTGIETDGNHLFLLADGTVTHNSYRAGSIAYKRTVQFRNGHVGIQSKNETDAGDFFRDKVVAPAEKLPSFLYPANSHGIQPVGGFFFGPANARGKKTQFIKKFDPTFLYSKMDHRIPATGAYDGTSLKLWVKDEAAKTSLHVCDLEAQIRTLKQVVFRDMKMRGKMYVTTTIEEMKEGGPQYKELHKKSIYRGEPTISGLRNYFNPASRCSLHDKFGYPDVKASKKIHGAERKRLEDNGDTVGLTQYIQQNPESVEEAFMSGGDECLFNAMILQRRQVICQNPDFPLTVRGNFEWANGIRFTKVIFVENTVNGLWEVSFPYTPSKTIDAQIPHTMFNRVKHTEVLGGKTYSPQGDGDFAVAVDPVAQAETVEANRRSDLGICVGRKSNYWFPQFSDTIVADFVGRHENPDDNSEEVIKACWFYGCKALIEADKWDTINTMEGCGMNDFVMRRPAVTFTQTNTRSGYNQDIRGIHGRTPSIDISIKRTKVFIIEHGHKLRHLRLVRSWLDLTMKNRGDNDLGVAGCWLVIAMENPLTEPKMESIPLESLIHTYDNSGSHSLRVS